MLLTPSLLRSWQQIRLQLDKIVLTSAVVNAFQGLSSLLAAGWIVHFLSAVEQGYWYTFAAILALCGYAEMGIGQVIMRFTAHEWSTSEGTRHEYSQQRLQGLFKIALIWGFGLAVIISTIALPSGLLVLGQRHDAIEWKSPWLFAAAVGPLWLILALLNSFTEGCQKIISSNVRRAIQLVFGTGTLFFSLSLGYGLWGFGFSALASFLAGSAVLLFSQGRFIATLSCGLLTNRAINWRDEIWPVQWRYAATWVASLFGPALITPILFSSVGPVSAGAFGFTWSLVGFISAYPLLWINARAPVFAKLTAIRHIRELNELFRSSFVSAFAILGIADVLVVVGYTIVLFSPWAPLTERVLPLPSLIILLVAQLIAALIQALSTYVRSGKVEPFVKAAWLSAGTYAITTPVGVSLAGSTGACLSVLLNQIVVLPLVASIFVRYRKSLTKPTSPEDPTGQQQGSPSFRADLPKIVASRAGSSGELM
jgi:hypothetical protein